MEAQLVGNINLNADILEAISFLSEQEYYVEHYITKKSTEGIVFALPRQLEKLQHYGWLTLIDSTHKTNKHNWYLFTLYVRDQYECWNVGSHFFVSNEDSETIIGALKIIRKKCFRWLPRYVLMDQSATEANSIKQVFPGLCGGEQECNIIFCTVHIMQTWMTKIYDVKAQETMILAMHKKTKIGCEKLIQEAIHLCSVSTVCRYIKKNYAHNSYQWALWSRQHSPLLLQVTSTNALESYHSELKRMTSHLYGLIGASHKIVALDHKRQADLESVAYNFNTKKIFAYGIENEIIEEIHKFPFPIQQMLIKEACAVMDRLSKSKNAPGLLSLNCDYLFRNCYMLPCKHIFHKHIFGTTKLLDTDTWRMFQELFDESGFEVYQHHELVTIEAPKLTMEERKAENWRLALSELTERLRNRYWEAEERNAEQAEMFISKLKDSLNPIINEHNTL